MSLVEQMVSWKVVKKVVMLVVPTAGMKVGPMVGQ